VYAFDMDGNPQWKRELGTMQTRNNFGEGSSAALYKDTLVVPFDHEGDSFIAALDAVTGEVRWKTARDEPTTWATPLIVEHDGRVQVVTNGTNRVRGYDLATGELLWACGGQATNPIACPVTLDGLVFCMTGYRGYAAYAIPLSSTGDITGTDRVAWKRTDAGPYIASPLLYDGRLYYTKDRHAVLMVTDAKSGKPIIDAERLPELGILYSSPVAAAGRIYITDRDGVTMVIEPGDSLKVLAMNRLGEGVDATPAIVGRQMFIRGEGHLYCIEQR
jgi:outer membrane protein assembly factor BamB